MDPNDRWGGRSRWPGRLVQIQPQRALADADVGNIRKGRFGRCCPAYTDNIEPGDRRRAKESFHHLFMIDLGNVPVGQFGVIFTDGAKHIQNHDGATDSDGTVGHISFD